MNTSSIALNATHMTPIERAQGRFMRAPEHPSAESAPQGNNAPPADGNSGAGDSNPNSPPNNTDGAFDIEQFWQQAEQADAGDSQNANEPPAIDMKALMTRASEVIKPNFTAEAMAQAANGDMSGINQAMQQSAHQTVQAVMQMMVPILQRFQHEVTTATMGNVDGRFQKDQQHAALIKAIPKASDPKVGPMIRQLYSTSLKATKGNVQEAIRATQELMKITSSEFAENSGPDNGRQYQAPATNWLESLMVNNSQ